MGNLLTLPMTDIQRLARVYQEEERAFQTVLEVLRESRRSDLVRKLDAFLRVRRRRILASIISRVSHQQMAHWRRPDGSDGSPMPPGPAGG